MANVVQFQMARDVVELTLNHPSDASTPSYYPAALSHPPRGLAKTPAALPGTVPTSSTGSISVNEF